MMKRILIALLLPSLALAASGRRVGVNPAPQITGNGSSVSVTATGGATKTLADWQANGPVKADATTVTATGSTTARTLKDRAADAFTLADFGAVCDGAADDTAAINLAGASGKRVLVPPGGCKATTTVRLTAAGTVFVAADPARSFITFSGAPSPAGTYYGAVALDADGTGLEGVGITVASGDYRVAVNVLASRTFVRRCKIALSTANVPAATLTYVIMAGKGGAPVLDDVRIEENDLRATNIPKADGVQASYITGLRVARNHIHDFTYNGTADGSWGIYVSSGTPGAIVDGNTIVNMPGSGIHLNSSDWTQEVGRRITNNYLSDVARAGILAESSYSPIIANNWVRRADEPIAILTPGEGGSITDNHVEDVVSLAAPLDSDRPMVATSVVGAVISANTIGQRGTAYRGIKSVGARTVIQGNAFVVDPPRMPIYVTGAQSVIAHNSISATTDATAASALTSQGADSRVVGNILTLAATQNGIQVAGDDSLVSGNRTIGGNVGLFVTSVADRVFLVDNTVTGQTGAGIYSEGTALMKRRNSLGGLLAEASGKATFNGTGAQTAFVITHGLVAAPTVVTVTPGHAGSASAFYATSNATTITVNFTAAPAVGTGNVVLNWKAETN